MAEIIATELQALAIGGGSCSSYVTYRAVTKLLATYFGASTRNNTYANSLLVRYVDLYKACNDSCYSCYTCNDSCYTCNDSCYTCNDSCYTCNDSCYTCDDCGDSCYSCNKCGDSCYTCDDCPSKCSKTNTCDWKTISYGKPSTEYKGFIEGAGCWPHGSFHTIGSTSETICTDCHDKTTCGCKGVGTGCGSYTGSTPCSGISIQSCACVNIQTCPCLAILTYPGTCSCHGAY